MLKKLSSVFRSLFIDVNYSWKGKKRRKKKDLVFSVDCPKPNKWSGLTQNQSRKLEKWWGDTYKSEPPSMPANHCSNSTEETGSACGSMLGWLGLSFCSFRARERNGSRGRKPWRHHMGSPGCGFSGGFGTGLGSVGPRGWDGRVMLSSRPILVSSVIWVWLPPG